MTSASAVAKPAQIRVARRSPAYWRVTLDNPPINVMGPEMVREFQEVINALEADEHVRVVVFDSAVEDYYLNHSDLFAKLEDLTSMPAGPTGLPPWPDFLVPLTRSRFKNKGRQPAFRVGPTVGPLSVSDRSKCYLVLPKVPRRLLTFLSLQTCQDLVIGCHPRRKI